MKEQLPAPEFDPNPYERPNQNWICGKAAEGKPCRIGPDAKGRCRVTYECSPALELKEGENKGRFRCTRTPEYGGPCDTGPLPSGTCSRLITKCVPVRSLRAKRKRFTMAVAACTAGVLLVGLCGPFRARFINPGEISTQHSTETFAKLAGVTNSESGCAACHASAGSGPSVWLASAFGATPGPLQVRQLAATTPPLMTVIDGACQHCHKAHSFHEPNVVREHSCSACHREHHGSGLMPAPTDANCLSCHASADVMEASFEKGKKFSPGEFDYRPDQGRVLFKAPRPERGYTKLIHAFATDHPEFQVIAEKIKDPNQLKFNHQLHLVSPRISPLKGGTLGCPDCHKPDAAGTLHLKITFEENCRECHSLQFDVNNPDLRLPHGNAEHVRAFLRNLPAEYADFASKKKGLVGKPDVDAFVEQQMKHVREQFTSGEELERRVFFSDARTGPVANVGGLGNTGAARFSGCAYCHQVTASAAGAPLVSRPFLPDRWLIRGGFDHAKHFKIACAACHDAEHSHDTSDVLLPSQRSCVECHSPKGGVASNCSTCHSYHSPQKLAKTIVGLAP